MKIVGGKVIEGCVWGAVEGDVKMVEKCILRVETVTVVGNAGVVDRGWLWRGAYSISAIWGYWAGVVDQQLYYSGGINDKEVRRF